MCIFGINSENSTFNRTRLECKFDITALQPLLIHTFNRTRLECKYAAEGTLAHSIGDLLIELD